VHFPAGTWLSGSIRLKSSVALYFEQGSTLVATEDPTAYDEAEPNQLGEVPRFGHSHFHNSLIWGDGLEEHLDSRTGPDLWQGLTALRQ